MKLFISAILSFAMMTACSSKKSSSEAIINYQTYQGSVANFSGSYFKVDENGVAINNGSKMDVTIVQKASSVELKIDFKNSAKGEWVVFDTVSFEIQNNDLLDSGLRQKVGSIGAGGLSFSKNDTDGDTVILTLEKREGRTTDLWYNIRERRPLKDGSGGVSAFQAGHLKEL